MPFRKVNPSDLTQLLVTVADNIASPLWSVNAQLQLTWSNVHFDQNFGPKFAEAESWRPLYARALETKQPVHGDESLELDGQQRHFAVSVYPVDGQLVMLCRDTTAQMKLYSLNEQLQREAAERTAAEQVRATIQQQMLLADRLTSVGTLAAGVAHEINNPLAAVLVNLQLAQEDTESLATKKQAPLEVVEHLREELRDAAAACERVKNIIRDLKVFARNSERDANGPINVHQVLELSMRMASNEIRHRARLTKDLKPIGAVHGNEAKLGQVFLNMLVNAAQAIEEGNAEAHEIRVATREGRAGFVEVEIADTGCGISPESLPRIFDPFFSTKPTGEGMGLGLSISHQIVTSMGGTIAVKSERGKGTTFTVALPVAATVALVSAPEPDALPLRRGRILSIDDEPMVGTFVRRVLGSQHDVEALTSATEALAKIKAGERYDVILCDVMMPQMTGLDLYWELNEVAQDQVKNMVFLTAGAFTASSRAFFDLTTQPRLEKPFDAQALRLLVNRIVNKSV